MDLVQNDLSLKNFIDQNSFVHSISGNSESKYFRKRQVDEKIKQNKQKSAAKTESESKVPPKKPLLSKPKPPVSKSKPPAAKPKPPTPTPKPKPPTPTPKPKPPTPTPKPKLPVLKPKPPTPKPSVPRPTTKKSLNVKAATKTTTPKTTPPKTTTKKQTTCKPRTTKEITPKTTPPKTTTKKQTTRKPRTTKEITPKTTQPKRTTQKETTTTSTLPDVKTMTTNKPAPPVRPKTPKPTCTTVKPVACPKLKSKLIDSINDLRLKHQAQNLSVNATLTNQAQKITDGQTLDFDSIDHESVGFTFGFASPKNGFNLLRNWVPKPEKIDYDNLDKKSVNLKFAQLVWVSTTDIGCGTTKTNDNKRIFTVCLFYPKGNIPGKYNKNVLRPRE